DAEAEALLEPAVEQGEAQAAALGDDADRPGAGLLETALVVDRGTEAGRHAGRHVEEALAVRPADPRRPAAGDLPELLLKRPAVRAALGEAGADDHRVADPGRTALFDQRRDAPGRGQDHRQVDRLRPLADGRVDPP